MSWRITKALLVFTCLCSSFELLGSQSIIFDAHQVEVLMTHIEKLLEGQSASFSKDVSSLSDTLIRHQIQPLSTIYTEILSVLKDADVFRDRMMMYEASMERLSSQLASVRTDLAQLQRDSRRCKRDLKAVKAGSKDLRAHYEEQKNRLAVFFDAVRYQDFSGHGNLTYEKSIVNEGGGLNITTGVFSAPIKGFYLFSFHANTITGHDALILFRRNGETVAGSYDTDNYNRNTISQSAIVLLRQRDLLWVDVISGGVRSNDNVYLHFVGMLLK